MQFKSVFESLENYYCNSIKYENTIHEPKKEQITGDALKHMIRFIDWCLIESKVKRELKKSKLERCKR